MTKADPSKRLTYSRDKNCQRIGEYKDIDTIEDLLEYERSLIITEVPRPRKTR